MKNIKILLTLLISITLFSSCDEIEKPYLRDNTGGGSGASVVKKVLLEDFTGHRCVNCPGAHLVAHDLQEQYGDQLIIVGIHAGYFATPSSGDFTADFTTEAGEQLCQDFQVIQFPSGMVNRTPVDGNTVINQGSWAAAVGSMVQGEAEVRIEMENNFNNANRKLNTSVDVTFLSNNASGTFNICLYITEDDIVAPQMNNDENIGETPEILNYVHHHVLRKAVNGTYGDLITNETINVNSPYSFDFTDIAIPNEWNTDNLTVIAFVINQENQQIIQAEQLGL